MRKIPVLITVLILLNTGSALAERLIVIANPGAGISSLSHHELQQIYLGRMVHWPDGGKAKPASLKAGAVHEAFLHTYLDISSAQQYDVFWKMAVFTGTYKPPEFFGSDREVVQYVCKPPGALGYISADIAHGNVKTLEIR